MITQQRLRELFDYVDGELVRKVSPRRRYAKRDCTEYLCTVIDKKVYRTHRLIYLYHHGYMPKQIDHIDGNKYNNRVENLRECLPSNNSMNIGVKKNNTTGFKGVTWEKARNKWRTRVCVQGKTVYSGRFDDIELAELVAVEARNKYHGPFANHGIYLSFGV